MKRLLLALMCWPLTAWPVTCNSGAQALAQSLVIINSLRSAPLRCGNQLIGPAPALRWSPLLAESAQRYAQELAARDTITHIGQTATSLRDRLQGVGYKLQKAAENLAGGPGTLEEATQLWSASPSHCGNLMAPDFTEAGLACVQAPGRLEHYWVLHLGRPAMRFEF
ncbi:CAP domain-containing protein [Roseateles sp. BYS180W]|uniref:CAP domain-containing protein n=1 Tax=Roseateles rivi TaxID=3299028 RepID=A0ABW7FU17_9BURK